jgi:hypothetical protein
MKNEKICLIGYGYWGKILHKNLLQLNYQHIKIVDEVLENYHEITEDYDFYFVVTPFSTHEKILKRLANFSNKKIWSEKPLVKTLKASEEIYALLEENGNKLFVDWTYTFNPCVHYLKQILENKKLKQVILNRTNNGPSRTDASSILDLASHDLSILYYIFGTEEKFSFTWNEFSMDKTKKIGSNVSWCYREGMQILINSSWQHEFKNRFSFFISDVDEIIVFDDSNKLIIENGIRVDFSEKDSPLHLALQNFFHAGDFTDNKKLTLKITESIS